MIFTRVMAWEIGGCDIGDSLGIDANDLLGLVDCEKEVERCLQTFLRRASSNDTGFGAIIRKRILVDIDWSYLTSFRKLKIDESQSGLALSASEPKVEDIITLRFAANCVLSPQQLSTSPISFLFRSLTCHRSQWLLPSHGS